MISGGKDSSSSSRTWLNAKPGESTQKCTYGRRGARGSICGRGRWIRGSRMGVAGGAVRGVGGAVGIVGLERGLDRQSCSFLTALVDFSVRVSATGF